MMTRGSLDKTPVIRNVYNIRFDKLAYAIIFFSPLWAIGMTGSAWCALFEIPAFILIIGLYSGD